MTDAFPPFDLTPGHPGADSVQERGGLQSPLRIQRAERAPTDRRRRPTPMMSRYWLRGRRRTAGRRGGDSTHVYVDRYHRGEVLLFAGLVVGSLADLVLTLIHLHQDGTEANPIMDRFLSEGGTSAFVAAKLGLTAIPALFLLLHVRFRGSRPALIGLSAMYGALLVYHALAAWDRAGL